MATPFYGYGAYADVSRRAAGNHPPNATKAARLARELTKPRRRGRCA